MFHHYDQRRFLHSLKILTFPVTWGGLWVVAVVSSCWTFFDLVLLPEYWKLFMIIRVASSVFIAILLLLTYSPRRRKYIDMVTFASTFLLQSYVAFMLPLSGSKITHYAMGYGITFLVGATITIWRPLVAYLLYAASAVVFIFAWIIIPAQLPSEVDVTVMIFYLGSILLLCIITVNLRYFSARTQFMIQTQLEIVNQELLFLSITDNLTQIFNRVKLESSLNEAIGYAKRYGTPFSVILLDLDHFKLVNDQHGHNIGDAVLKQVAQVLSCNIRETDILGRWGGEEFLMILPHANLSTAGIIAEKLRDMLEREPFLVIGQKTGSFGVASYIKGDKSVDIIKRADDALYDAKRSGRNRVSLYEQEKTSEYKKLGDSYPI